MRFGPLLVVAEVALLSAALGAAWHRHSQVALCTPKKQQSLLLSVLLL